MGREHLTRVWGGLRRVVVWVVVPRTVHTFTRIFQRVTSVTCLLSGSCTSPNSEHRQLNCKELSFQQTVIKALEYIILEFSQTERQDADFADCVAACCCCPNSGIPFKDEGGGRRGQA
jgi:hypothetical protein